MSLKYSGFLTIFLFSCMNQSVQYSYADGSANRYVITPYQIDYIPVKPQESSSGTYSGGEPQTVRITKDQFEKISTLLEDAFQSTNSHIENRIKSSGLVEKTNGTEQTSCILNPKSASLSEIEKALNVLLNH
jgi:hypothetical protein